MDEEQQLEVKYGLPRQVKFCTRCVISNQRPNSTTEFKHGKDSKKETIHFDDEGVCDACRVAEQKASIDWEQRERELVELCDRYRRTDGRYDCIVPGSGGKDSFYASHLLRYKYGMHPLTVTWAPHIYTEWGWRNFERWIHSGFDNYLMTPNGRAHRVLTRAAVENLFHPFQPFILGQKSIAAKMSVLFDVPLVFYGENEAEYGNPISDTNTSLRDDRFHKADINFDEIQLGGVNARELIDEYGLDASDLEPYLPAKPEGIERVGTAVHYLGYYLKWHPQGCYYYARDHGGFEPSPERTPGTYSKYNSIDDRIDDFHYYTTYIKFGIGRATYDAAQEVRSGDIERDEAVALVRRYDGEFPERFAEEIFKYLSLPPDDFPEASRHFNEPIMTRETFANLEDQFRSPHLWEKTSNGWALRHTVFGDDI